MEGAWGDLVNIAVHPEGQDAYDEAMSLGTGMVYLKHPPLGLWLRMEKYCSAPFTKMLR